MIPQPSPVGLALTIEFVADLSYNPRTDQYRIELTEPYRSVLPRDRNYLLVDAPGFTIQKLLATFQRDVVEYYQQRCDEAQQTLDQIRDRYEPVSGS